MIEVRGATIVTSADILHAGPIYGYWLVCRLWDSIYLKDLEELLGAKAALTPPTRGRPHGNVHSRQVILDRPLRAADGSILGYLHIAKDCKEADIQAHAARRTLVLLSIFAALVTIALYLTGGSGLSHPAKTADNIC